MTKTAAQDRERNSPYDPPMYNRRESLHIYRDTLGNTSSIPIISYLGLQRNTVNVDFGYLTSL